MRVALKKNKQYSGAPIYFTCRVDYVRAEYAYVVIPDQPSDILVRQKNLLSALNRDLVKVCLLPSGPRKRQEGVVVEIIVRNTAPLIN